MRWGRALLAATIALALAAGATHSQTRELTPDEMRSLAARAIAARAPETAITLTNALLRRDPEDHAALVLRARAARDAGDYAGAQKDARRAWELAKTDPQRHESAMVMAQALSSDGSRTRAQFWLRRAAEHAPDASARRRAVRDYRYVRTRNPLSMQFSASLAPNSNVNNGSISDTTQFFDPFTRQYVDVELQGASRALSGLELSLGASLHYRIAESPDRATDLLAYADSRSYRLSNEARSIAPTARGADFATQRLTLGIEHRWLAAGGRVEHRIGATFGKTRYGGAPYSDTARLAYDAAIAMPGRNRLRFGVAGQRTRGARAPHADSLRLSASFQQRLRSGGSLVWAISAAESDSDNPSADYRDVTASLDYALPRPILGALPSLGLSLRKRDYPVSPYGPSGREDREIAARLQLTFTEIDYYGFNPVMTLEAARSESNIGLFDIDRVGLQFGIRSAF